jgi:hypothetical protein
MHCWLLLAGYIYFKKKSKKQFIVLHPSTFTNYVGRKTSNDEYVCWDIYIC